jgi:hypothetical protein
MWPRKGKKSQRPSWPNISSTTNQASSSDYFETTSYWDSEDPKKLFVPATEVLRESASNCLVICINFLQHCNSLEAARVDAVDAHNKDGLWLS